MDGMINLWDKEEKINKRRMLKGKRKKLEM